ncbi:MAG: hypothetical protein CML47_00845 [Rhodobacteraceae bacterium]|nr:MAG: hypothetical protein CML47_00845 [Paracoccaceae bacterium]|tara:strand:+ start:1863 stop:3431 length:1569 start_codon:yes stop_codon:yes gene_type:complete
MICKISCSVGELIDKISILKIKLKKSESDEIRENIIRELNCLTSENPISETCDDLFLELSEINNKLWILEDNIRIKSQNKDYDREYIEMSEKIHITNDQRYMVKKKINTKYSSYLKEEKIYTIAASSHDAAALEKGKHLYTSGDYVESYTIINNIMNKYENYDKFDSFYVDLLFSYANITSIFNYENVHMHKIDKFMKTIDNCKLSLVQITFCKDTYVMQCLKYLKYNESKPYLAYYNSISGPNVNKENVSFFKKDDIGKTLLIYDGGGFGDKFMLSRFIPILCNKYNNNNIVFFINDELYWIFIKIFNNIHNLTIIKYSNHSLMPKFEYHTNLIKLIDFLNYDYNTLPKQLSLDATLCASRDIQLPLTTVNKKKYILNWFGASNNNHEKHNRRMELRYALPLFKLENTQWIVISKNVNENEQKLLSEYNVLFYGNQIDTQMNAFEESVNIIKNVDAVISTDTSLVHISPCLNIKTFVLLTVGYEWRWETSNWYPDSVLIKQTEYGNWKGVIDRLINKLTKI